MLEEMVDIYSIDPPRKLSTSRLAIGKHGLPVLLNAVPPTEVWNFPANWQLRTSAQGTFGVLISAWHRILDIQRAIAQAEREGERGTHDRQS
jgi:hypothetical protein